MFDLYLTGPYVPFTLALALLFGLLALEIVLLFLGGTLIGLEADADFDVDVPELGDLDIDLGGADPNLFDFADPATEIGSEPSPGPTSWLSMGKVPVLIWVAALLLAFGVAGYLVQSVARIVLGGPLPAMVTMIPAAFVGVWFARTFGEVFARILPKTETTALSERRLGRRMGVVTQGTARAGTPAEVRVTDHHGNMHYLRAEPVRDTDEIPTGTPVLVLKHRHEPGFRIIPLGQDAA